MTTPILVRWGTTWFPGQLLESCPGKPGWVWASSAAFRGRKLLVAGEWKEQQEVVGAFLGALLQKYDEATYALLLGWIIVKLNEANKEQP